jgi:FlaA1/EpsC-like NDP-sugar epimerase
MKPMTRMLFRAAIVLTHDGMMAAISFLIALRLRIGVDFYNYSPDLATVGTIIFTTAAVCVFIATRLYRGVWRYASIEEMMQIARAVGFTILIFVFCMFFISRLQAMPRSALMINWFVLVALMGGSRLAYRILKDRGARGIFSRRPAAGSGLVPVLLVGASDGAELFIRAMSNVPQAPYRVVGLVDDKGTRVGRVIHGLSVLGDLDSLPTVVEKLAHAGNAPQRIIVTEDSLSGVRLRKLVDVADKLGLTVARLPKITDFRTEQSDAPVKLEMRPIAIEDLLGRPQTVLDRDQMRQMIVGKRVLVTGAGGTIGSELVRQIADHGPAQLTLLDHSEYALYSIDLEISERQPNLWRRSILADVRERARIMAVIAEEQPELVFHAAALKHVPVVETHPVEGVLTNVVGTRNVAEACKAAGVSAMVLISTDKAVNPSSVMGATKRLAECCCQLLNAQCATHYVTVRFGNVLGSTGSVVPLFQRQLAAGGPLTVTHPEVKRYFMTVREAVELVLEATVLGLEAEGQGERIYVLDMGEPVRIADLARQMIRLAGLRPEVDVKITFTGLRPGEKLNEELFHTAEILAPTRYAGIQLAAPRTVDAATLARGLDELETAARGRDTAATLALIAHLVPEYSGARPAEPPISAAAS